jgi:hypothetical protein
MPSQSARLRAAREAHRAGNLQERNRLVSESIAALQSASTDADRASCAHALACFYRDLDDVAQCEKYARAAVESVKRSGSAALLGNHLMFLALLLRDADRLDEAIQHVEQALPCYVRAWGPEHREVEYVASVLASLRRQRAVLAGSSES